MRKAVLLLLLCVSCAAFSQTNTALSFNGTSTVVSINMPIPTGSSYTKEAWVLLNTSSGPRNIISSQNNPFWIDNGVLKAGNGSNYSVVTDPTAFTLNVWTHVAVTYDAPANTMRLYRNGTLVNTNTAAPAFTAENTFIGSHFGTASFFSGSIDEIRIWKTVRTAQQLKDGMWRGPAANAAGLLAHYRFNDGSGTALANSCTNGDAAVNGAITSGSWVSSPVNFSANAISLNGTNNYIDLGTSAGLKFTSNFTAEVWAKANNWSSSAEQYILSCYQTGGYGIFISGGNIHFAIMTAGTSVYTYASHPVGAIVNGSWVHLAASFDGRYMKLYVNGTLAVNRDLGITTTISYSYPGNSLMIGVDPDDASGPSHGYFAGAVDELRIWNTVRTEAEIQANRWRELNPADAGQTANLVSYYTFNGGMAEGSNAGLTQVIDQKGTNNGTLRNFTLTGSSSNYVAQQVGMVVLPLRWLSFTAQRSGSNVALQWTTAEENNTLDFSIQHSSNGSRWTTIGTLPAAGGTAHKYAFTHTNAPAGTNHYRIAQQDRDGRFSYSENRMVQVGNSGPAFSLAGNRVTGSLVLQVNEACVVTIYSLDGKTLQQQQVNKGQQTLTIGSLAKGLYMIRGGDVAERFLVQ